MKALIVNGDMVTGYGNGTAACWDGILAGRSAVRTAARFATRNFVSGNAATVAGLDPGDGSLVTAMLDRLLDGMRAAVPSDAALILATTTARIDLLERACLEGRGEPEASTPESLLALLADRLGTAGPAMVISAACASSTVAVGQALDMIRSGETQAAVVIGCDAVTEFVFSGFSALTALTPGKAKPFDRDRDGLSLGEAAAWILLMSPERAANSSRHSLAAVAGWGCAGDANHMTGPSRDGSGLADAVRATLDDAGVAPDHIDAVCAHGTGTRYNDAMEMQAFRSVFGADNPRPVFSIKGGTGHTLGAAGLLEVLVTAESLRQGVVPPTVGLECADQDAAGWVRPEPLRPTQLESCLSTNSGFGGINAAVLLEKAP